ncbi:NACHT domain-containing protein [Fusarium sp. LHS14.1]|nr:NACHT domain-containing protein [Fusarium sp. LHS14.1]
MASNRGFLAVCILLISKGADINGPGDESVRNPLEVAASRGDADMVAMFLRGDVRPDISRGALDVACKMGHYRAARLVFEAQGSPIDSPQTVLLHSIQGGNLPLTEYLLGRGLRDSINDDLVNSIMNTFERVQYGHEVLEMLLSMGNGILNGKSIDSAMKRGLIRETELMLRCPRLRLDDTERKRILEASLLYPSSPWIVRLLDNVLAAEAPPEA